MELLGVELVLRELELGVGQRPQAPAPLTQLRYIGLSILLTAVGQVDHDRRLELPLELHGQVRQVARVGLPRRLGDEVVLEGRQLHLVVGRIAPATACGQA